MKEKLLQLLKEREEKYCVLGTSSSDNQPWCAVVGYVVADDGTVTISTHTNSKKWKNCQENNKVSLLFGFGFHEPNIQVEGIATLVDQGEEFEKLKEYFYTANPHAEAFASDDTAFISIALQRGRVSDFRQTPPNIEEFDFLQ